MRELKFRAWKKKHCPEMINISYIDWNEQVAGFKYRLSTTTYRDDREPLSNLILMQYTGLKDKNGVEIYEGDVIGLEDRTARDSYVGDHVIVWKDTALRGKQICSSGSYIGIDYWTSGKNGYEVIGNIYENPELLDKEMEK